MKSKDWTDQQISTYYTGIQKSDYPKVVWNKIKPQIKSCSTLQDIGCGPGAFSLAAAADGFNVKSIDISNKSLESLKKRAENLGLNNIRTVCGDWLELETGKSEVSVCSYCFGGAIGTVEGIKKVLDSTTNTAFFISPCEKVKIDFLTKDLFAVTGIEPLAFKDFSLLEVFKKLGYSVESDTIKFDFGMPLVDKENVRDTAVFLCDKLNFPYEGLMAKHIKKIMMAKNGLCWLPNPKKAKIITWRRRGK